jgi:hypothetical protein
MVDLTSSVIRIRTASRTVNPILALALAAELELGFAADADAKLDTSCPSKSHPATAAQPAAYGTRPLPSSFPSSD